MLENDSALMISSALRRGTRFFDVTFFLKLEQQVQELEKADS